MNILCEHIKHGCKTSTFIYCNDKKKVCWLENPKAASSLIKSSLEGFKQITLEQLLKRKEYYIFGIKRDPVDKMVSIYRNFCKDQNEFRVQQMASLFKLSASKIKDITFDRFCELSMENMDHHWNSNSTYLLIQNLNVDIYDIKDINDLFRKLEGFGIHIPHTKVNSSKSSGDVEVSDQAKNIIFHIFKEDYENLLFVH